MSNWVKRYSDKERARNLRNMHRKRNYSKTQGYPPRDWTVREMTVEEERFLKDVDVCIRLLEVLKGNYYRPGYGSTVLNSSKISRARQTIHDLLKKY